MSKEKLRSSTQSEKVLLTFMLELLERFDQRIQMIEKIKALGREDIALANEVTINRGQTNKAENAIEKWLELIAGHVIAELDFIDKTTFGYFDSIPKSCGIRVITSGVKDPDKCIAKANSCAKDRPYLEIVKINKIHQRWIGSEESFFIDVGADLKRDALGNSTHVMRKLPPSAFIESVSHFESLWASSQEELRSKYGRDWQKSTFFSSRRDTRE